MQYVHHPHWYESSQHGGGDMLSTSCGRPQGGFVAAVGTSCCALMSTCCCHAAEACMCCIIGQICHLQLLITSQGTVGDDSCQLREYVVLQVVVEKFPVWWQYSHVCVWLLLLLLLCTQRHERLHADELLLWIQLDGELLIRIWGALVLLLPASQVAEWSAGFVDLLRVQSTALVVAFTLQCYCGTTAPCCWCTLH